jgi:hypothetical protein
VRKYLEVGMLVCQEFCKVTGRTPPLASLHAHPGIFRYSPTQDYVVFEDEG